ncbi:hypothetical protein AIOL_002506 [Candidatus Rhodobacter oscarellae]|uniref:Uncharacterized protein n=1 Tax=Candidatus Rhodobacter oscarellae TaxID=1675527 RepID=A0A0J9E406_9RHOB|nr:hypothetical protein [Candidatus Rhodobacter lobularis]KMW57541.1 hypothetical protein AIOL_002506 [Candidatus Rhodobacter lobularis]
MAREYRIGALWIGGSLSFLEQLCLKSFADAGHHVTLFTYGEVQHIPDGIEVADGNEVLSTEHFIRHTRTGSPAPQADRFRYHMLAKYDDIIWADTDAYCVQPFTTENGHFYGWESAHHVNNGVLGLPKDSDTLQELIAFTSDEYAIPEWLPAAEQDRLRAAKQAGAPIGVGDQQWGAWGPRALTHFLHKTGEIRHALPREALYPIGFKERGLMVRPGANTDRFLTANTLSIHFYGRRMRERIMNEGGEPAKDSLIGRLLDKHSIVPSDAPLPAPPPKLERLPPEARRGRGKPNLTDLADEHGNDRGSLRHRYTELYQMLFLPLRERKLRITLVGLDGGGAVDAPDSWVEIAKPMLAMWIDYFPKAEFTVLDRAEKLPVRNKRVTYHQSTLEDPGEIAALVPDAPDIVIDDATHASHHQQNAIRALFPKLANGGLYVVEDLRTQPASLEEHGLVKTAALFNGYLDAGVFDHPDEKAKAELNDIRADISGCFVFQAAFQKQRRDQMLVIHKR